MAIVSFPYVSIDGDRKITAAQEAEGYDMFLQSGVVPIGDELLVSKVPDTLNVSIAAGKAVISGHRYIQPDAVILSFDQGDVSPRIDIVALESNANTPARTAQFVIVKGTPATSPVAPELTNDAAVQQQEYAQIVIPAGAQSLNSATLTDKRVYARGRHNHDANNVDGLQVVLDNKAAKSHTHEIDNITGLLNALNSKESLLPIDRKRKITISTSNPSGGADGDIWLKII